MSIASMAHFFLSGINGAPNNTSSLEALVSHQLEIFARERENTSKSAPLATPTTPAVPLTQATSTSVIPDSPAPATPATLAPESPKLAPIAPIPPPRPRSNTIITETGDYLVALAGTYGRLTAKLVSGAHVDKAVVEVHEHSRLTNRFSDMTTVVAMDVEQQRLRKIQQLAEKFSRDVQEAWHPRTLPNSPEPAVQQSPFSSSRERFSLPRVPLLGPVPAPETETALTVKTHANQRPLPSSQASPIQTSPAGDVTMSEDSDDEEEETFSKIDMDALKQRGKGSYFCPLGHRCDKGGVDKSGNLVLFDRNSSFAQHCNKHRKPWRCEIPGCPNPLKKRRFARRDGLERHKATVKHRVGS